ncbi:Methylmalonate-semialdehyde dehydrogenase [acylating], mitochondrial -like protein [Gossypium arboreum]|uniref:Methylmalonate-semialdehyde dehydrogenase [acylating], mitochondrial-like protein n=1 Tax=Gossypium arboreum TaxID=29729 RepID=A0A0B0P8Q8_GOSAR|nr:Methylmalonate-semialdehyde dehydrogenase [acylating], mitochondrial -like protein [Gossypium arboreum]
MLMRFSLQRVKNLLSSSSYRFSTATEPSLNQRNPPATQEVISQVPLTTNEEFKAAVAAAKQAFPYLGAIPLRQEYYNRTGKTSKDAHEVVEHARGMATLQIGEYVPNVSSRIDTYSVREPLRICAGNCPFNFPAMIPLWCRVVTGNTFILKPSERDPGASIMLAELAIEAGLPHGVLNIVHGTNDIVNAICYDDDIRAMSFVGSNTSNMGAKNHGIVMPEANKDATLNALVAAGQRCMALGTIVFAGDSESWFIVNL